MLLFIANTDSCLAGDKRQGDKALANKKFVVELGAEERTRLRDPISKGKAPAKVILKARILLKADRAEGGAGWRDDEICTALDTNVTMVQRVREKLVTEGLDAVLVRKKRETPPITPIFDGESSRRVPRGPLLSHHRTYSSYPAVSGRVQRRIPMCKAYQPYAAEPLCVHGFLHARTVR